MKISNTTLDNISHHAISCGRNRAQLKPWQRAIREQRKLERLLDTMRQLSRHFLEATTPGVKKRKPRP